MESGDGCGNPCWPELKAAASAAPWKCAANANGCPPWLCIISGCIKPFFVTKFGSYVGFGLTRVCAGIPGTIIGGLGEATGDFCGGDEELFSLFSLSLDGDKGAELSEKCTGDCWGLGWFAPPTIESIEKPIFGFEGTGTTGVGASGIMFGFTGTVENKTRPSLSDGKTIKSRTPSTQ